MPSDGGTGESVEATHAGANDGRPRVSVVIPCYNGRRYLEECLASVVVVADATWEVLVVDDGSTEDIREVVDRFAPVVRYLRQANRGPAAARNMALRQTSGEYVRFLDADDLLMSKEVAAEQIALLDRHPEVGMVYGRALRIDASGRPFGFCGPAFAKESYVRSGDEEIRSLLLFNYVTTSTTVARRSVLERVGPIREDLFSAEDWDLWLRIARVSAIGYLVGLVAAYRVHESSVTARYTPERWLTMHRDILESAYSDKRFAERYGALRRPALARLDQRVAYLAYKRAPPRVARRYVVKAVASSLSAGRWGGALSSGFILVKTLVPVRLRHWLRQGRLGTRRLVASVHARSSGLAPAGSRLAALAEQETK